MFKITQAQLDSFKNNIQDRFTVYQALPETFEIVDESDKTIDYIGVWVGNHNNPQMMYIGIEPDGYTHS